MDFEDMDEDFEYAGECNSCGETLDMSEAGFCKECGSSFCWGTHGGWEGNNHCCDACKAILEKELAPPEEEK